MSDLIGTVRPIGTLEVNRSLPGRAGRKEAASFGSAFGDSVDRIEALRDGLSTGEPLEPITPVDPIHDSTDTIDRKAATPHSQGDQDLPEGRRGPLSGSNAVFLSQAQSETNPDQFTTVGERRSGPAGGVTQDELRRGLSAYQAQRTRPDR